MITVEKPGTPEELVHVGTKGMKWGVRNKRDVKNTISNTKSLNKALVTKTPKAIAAIGHKKVSDLRKSKQASAFRLRAEKFLLFLF